MMILDTKLIIVETFYFYSEICKVHYIEVSQLICYYLIKQSCSSLSLNTGKTLSNFREPGNIPVLNHKFIRVHVHKLHSSFCAAFFQEGIKGLFSLWNLFE